jgi:hypothetical protein
VNQNRWRFLPTAILGVQEPDFAKNKPTRTRPAGWSTFCSIDARRTRRIAAGLVGEEGVVGSVVKVCRLGRTTSALAREKQKELPAIFAAHGFAKNSAHHTERAASACTKAHHAQ